MKRLIQHILPILVGLFILPVAGEQEDHALQQMERDLQHLKAEQVDLLFPTEYRSLEKQLRLLQTNAFPTSQVSQRATGLRLAHEIQSWQVLGARVRRELNGVLTIRERCALMSAADFASDAFSSGDKKLLEAAQFFVSGDREAMSAAVAVAERNYLKAELKTIRENLLGDIRIKLQEAANLHGPRYLPVTYNAVRSLQREVETLQKNATISSDELYLKSQELATAAARLFSLLYTVHHFRDDAGAAERFLIGLIEKSEILASQLNIQLQPEQDIQEQLQAISDEVRDLKSGNEQLLSENRQLKNRHAEVQKVLLSYQTVSEREDFLDSILLQFSKTLARPLHRQAEALTIAYDSLRYADFSGDALSLQLEKLLAPLAKALRNLPATDILLQIENPKS